MGFTKALYYPTIDIHNEGWLKTAVLFWDEINTIVPSSVKVPYQTHSTQFLSDKGILKSLRVNPDYDFIDELSSDVLNYLNTNEGFQVLTQSNGLRSIIHRDKLPRKVGRLFNIHPEKLPYEVQNYLRNNLTRDGWFQVDSNFATFYMTILANKLCERRSMGLLTDNSFTANLIDKVRLDNQFAINDASYFHRYDHRNQKPLLLAQGLLTNLIIQGVRVGVTSSLEDVLNFKDQHRDELGLFRMNISKLIQSVSKEAPVESLMQQVEDIYKDEFLPAYNNFKKALDSSRIKWFSDNFMKISLISMPVTTLPMTLLGFTLPHALLAGVGVSLVSSVVSYNEDKKEKIRTNPYSYLLAINDQI
ncbi:hypothetical protein [Desulfosporosinus sp. BG]|uniref:hypothetical protein n=1 Tax=Desulfosporosinus sp. BG TaxID=1633135 RepID=UPI000857AB24|nr:hypothetical protein [Desulfosporosinus sp. BG]ODA41818.1 hypothetical protein DSBG_1310 [Desulfosporosinus sp. BG]